MEERLHPALRELSDAVLAVAAQRSVDEVLQGLVDRARVLAGARYAALGIPDGDGGVSRFLVSGMSEQLIARLRAPPRPPRVLAARAAAAHARDARRDARRAGAVPHARHPHRSTLSRLVAGRAPRHALVPRR